MSTPQIEEPDSPKTAKPTTQDTTRLRNLPAKYRFSKTTYAEQTTTEHFDRLMNGNTKPISNIVQTAMALNEEAAKAGDLYFLHLPSWDTLKMVLKSATNRTPKPEYVVTRLIWGKKADLH